MHACLRREWVDMHTHIGFLSYGTANLRVKANWPHVVHRLRRAYGSSYDKNPVILQIFLLHFERN